MKRLFLSASFSAVAKHFSKFMKAPLVGLRVAFIPTACDVEAFTGFMDDDRQAFLDLGLQVDELDLSAMDKGQLAQKIAAADCIFVGGGNTFYLLQRLRQTGLDEIIIKAVEQGKPYVGTSAGSVIAALDIVYLEQMDDRSLAPELVDTHALGLVDFYVLPHFQNPPFVAAAQAIYQTYHQRLNLVPISNHQAIVATADDWCVIE